MANFTPPAGAQRFYSDVMPRMNNSYSIARRLSTSRFILRDSPAPRAEEAFRTFRHAPDDFFRPRRQHASF